MAEESGQALLKSTILKFLDETFENTHGIYLDKNTSLLETLEAISAEEASRPISPKGPSIAAHTEHTRFYLQVLEDYILNRPVGKIDWEETWRTTQVTPKEWTILKTKLKERYLSIVEIVNGLTKWDDERELGGILAVIVHTAYHVGAIRQITYVVK